MRAAETVEALSAALAGTARRVNRLLDERTGVLTSMNTVLGKSRRDLVEGIAFLVEAVAAALDEAE